MNSGFEYRGWVGEDGDGEALLGFLARRYRHASEEVWRGRIEAGRVWVGAVAVTDPGRRLRRGEVVAWRRPPWVEPEAPEGFAVLHEDPDVLVVAKPSGLPTLPGGGFLERTLLHAVRRRVAEASPLHRLGRFTSGIVLFARTAEARAGLSRQWAAREVGKRYRALASGRAAFREIAVDTPIGPVPCPRLGSVHAASASGKPSLSRVRVVEQRADDFLCDVEITTGRPHQIRIHLAAAGHPLVGDPLYAAGGLPRAGGTALPGDPGYLLHAAGLTFRHPRTGRAVRVECAPPPPLRRSRPGGEA